MNSKSQREIERLAARTGYASCQPKTLAAKQRRWYEKLLADPVRLAAFRAKYNTASRMRYHAERSNPAAVERHRASRRKAALKRYYKIVSDPVRREAYRKAQQKYWQAFPDKYVAARLKVPPDECPKDLIQLKRSHLQLKRELRRLKK